VEHHQLIGIGVPRKVGDVSEDVVSRADSGVGGYTLLASHPSRCVSDAGVVDK